MRTGICPKCKANAVYATNTRDNNFMLPTSSLLGMATVAQVVSSERYVCVNCGYFERYVSDRELLNAITSSSVWIKVGN